MKVIDELRLSAKLFAQEPRALDARVFVEIFHRWIQERRLKDELMVDVADYTHVQDGPVILVCDGAHYSLDEADGRFGLVYCVKRHPASSVDPTSRLRHALRALVRASRQLEAESALKGRLRFRSDEILFRFHNGPVALDSASISELETTTERVVSHLFAGTSEVALQRLRGPRPLTLRVRVTGAPPLPVLDERAGEPHNVS